MLDLEIASQVLKLDAQATLTVYINDNSLDPVLVTHVGFVPGQAGVYQLTVQLPPDAPANPEVRVDVNGFRSPAGFKIALHPELSPR